MRIAQARWDAEGGWNEKLGDVADAQLVLVFGSSSALEGLGIADLRRTWPQATLLGCSTAGEIGGTTVADDTIVATAIRFERSSVAGARVDLRAAGGSLRAGTALATAFAPEGLVHVFVLSDGLHVNGSELVKGLTDSLPPQVTVTGGLSGDGSRFGRTLVLWNDSVSSDAVAAIGLYGDRLRVNCASLGGWDQFGPERVITRSEGNVLYDLDGRPALDLYKRYLGPDASGLPATGLLYPLALRTPDSGAPVVRTILSVDEAVPSMTFAGDVPTGSYARLMRANFDRLVEGAAGAARAAAGGMATELAILISCVGRRLVLQQRVEEEIEAVRDVVGHGAVLSGFYSYGEISPFVPNARCELHNQTMTVTTFAEV